MADERQTPTVTISEEILKGTYSNSINISHTRGEFLLDCMTVFPPKGIIGARIIITPGHAKRLLKALQDNLARYEKAFGEISRNHHLLKMCNN
jgi:hypothetical protein